MESATPIYLIPKYWCCGAILLFDRCWYSLLCLCGNDSNKLYLGVIFPTVNKYRWRVQLLWICSLNIGAAVVLYYYLIVVSIPCFVWVGTSVINYIWEQFSPRLINIEGELNFHVFDVTILTYYCLVTVSIACLFE